MSSTQPTQAASVSTKEPADCLLELVYISMAVPAEFPEAALGNTLTSSRQRNAELGVTGVLLYQSGAFVQLLEGPQDAVRHLYYDRIRADFRHRGIVTCWEQALSKRSFPDWWMGFVDGGMLGVAAPPGWLAHGLAGLALAAPALAGPSSAGRKLLLSLVGR